uniref:Uncharacterized protein n=1 Tax=Arundo donax TaxID=35708 RepID=A0A0A8Y308_ARUDO
MVESKHPDPASFKLLISSFEYNTRCCCSSATSMSLIHEDSPCI